MTKLTRSWWNFHPHLEYIFDVYNSNQQVTFSEENITSYHNVWSDLMAMFNVFVLSKLFDINHGHYSVVYTRYIVVVMNQQ